MNCPALSAPDLAQPRAERLSARPRPDNGEHRLTAPGGRHRTASMRRRHACAAGPGTSRRCRAGAARTGRTAPRPARPPRAGSDARRAAPHRPCARHITHHDARLGQMRRAGDVRDHPTGTHGVERPGEQPALQPAQLRDARRIPPPARLGPPAQRAQPGAGRVEHHPVERPRPPRGLRAVGGDHGGLSGGLPDQPRPVILDIAGQQPGATRERLRPRLAPLPGPRLDAVRRPGTGEPFEVAVGGDGVQQPRLAARPRAQVQPAARPARPSGTRVSASATSWLASSCTAARVSAMARICPGSPSCR